MNAVNARSHRALVIFAWALVGLNLLVLLLGFASIPRFIQRASTLTITPVAGDVVESFSNEMVLAEAGARGMSPPFFAVYWAAISLTFALIVMALAGLVLWRGDRHWFTGFTAAILLFMAGAALNDILLGANLLPSLTPWSSITGLFWPVWVLYFFLFPTGEAIPRRGLWPVLILTAADIVYQATYLPGIADHAAVAALRDTHYDVFVNAVLFLLIIVFQVYRYRRAASREEQQQIKWIVYSGVALVVFITALILVGPDAPYFREFTLIAVGMLPLALIIAILRYRLFAIDVIIRRTLIYGVLTAILGAVYFGGVTLLQTLFADLIGSESTLAVVISTLVIAALFRPLQVRVQRFIDRRFYRQNYDAAQTLEAFADTVRDEIAVEDVEAALLHAVDDTMHPQSVGLWIREGHR